MLQYRRGKAKACKRALTQSSKFMFTHGITRGKAKACKRALTHLQTIWFEVL